MDITGSTALVTGANRGLGRHFAAQLLERGARRVYAGVRDPASIDLPGVEVVRLDVTDPASVAAAAAAAGDVTLLVNNAGISQLEPLVTGDLAVMRRQMEVNHFGMLAMIRAFAPVLAAGGGGAILNVLSAASWSTFPANSGYGASKAAAWSLTDHARIELADQGTQVTGLYVALTDTDMTAGFDAPKNDPADVVERALDGLASGDSEVLADSDTVEAKAALALAPPQLVGPS